MAKQLGHYLPLQLFFSERYPLKQESAAWVISHRYESDVNPNLPIYFERHKLRKDTVRLLNVIERPGLGKEREIANLNIIAETVLQRRWNESFEKFCHRVFEMAKKLNFGTVATQMQRAQRKPPQFSHD